MENDPFIDGLPIKNGGFFHGKLLNNQMVRLLSQRPADPRRQPMARLPLSPPLFWRAPEL